MIQHTSEQLNVLECIRNLPQGHTLIIPAAAGSAKTYTILEAAKELYDELNGRILILTFNKAAALDILKRVDYIPASTIHSFCYKVLKDTVGIQVDSSDVQLNKYIETVKNYYIKFQVKSFIGYLFNSGYELPGISVDLNKAFESSGILPPTRGTLDDVFKWATAYVSKVRKSEPISMNFDAMQYMTAYMLASNKIKVIEPPKVIFIDESQDLNASQLSILRSMQSTYKCSLVFIGDPYQTLYMFRGADVNTFDTVISTFDNVTSAELNVSFRCPVKIIQLAQQYMPEIRAFKTEDGVIERFDSINAVYKIVRADPDNTAVIASTNAEIIHCALGLMSKAIPFRLNGVALISRMRKETEEFLKIGSASACADYITQTTRKMYNNGTPKNVVKAYMDMANAALCIYREALRIQQPPMMLIEKMIAGKEGVTLCTIYTAKGLEWNTVIFLGYEELNEMLDESFDILLRNLLYVGVTRAKNKLYLENKPESPI